MRKFTGEIDEARRRVLVQALGLGVLAGGVGWNVHAAAALFGRKPYQLPAGQSVFDVVGTVTADGKPVTSGTVLSGSERLEAGAGSHLVAVVGKDAFLLRQHSTLELQAAHAAKTVFRLVTGALLTVFARRSESEELVLHTPVATIGIRGTGVYMEADPEKSYVCTCYGRSQLAVADDPSISEQHVSKHHDAPRYVLAKPDGGKRIVPAPFINHTDVELMTLEALVGRTVPFRMPGNEYDAPRREDY